jgi:K+-sensing histidine kinase KdpD
VAEDLLSLYSHIHQIIAKLLPAENFAIALYDQDSNQLDFPYQLSVSDQNIAYISNANYFAEQIIQTGQSLLFCPMSNTLSSPLAVTFKDCWLGVPLRLHKGVIGALIMHSNPGSRSYTTQDCELVEFVSTQIAFAIERRQMLARLEQIALYDQLTHLPNRELFYDRFQKALSRAHRDSSYFSTLFRLR